MNRLFIAFLLFLTLATPAFAQPGGIRSQLNDAAVNAVEKQRIRDGHFYAKSPIEPRWVNTWSESMPYLKVVAFDDTPRWYEFWRGKSSRGFWFDITSGSDLGPVSKLDKDLLAAMRHALLNPVEAAVGLDGDTVLFCLVENAKYDPVKFNSWYELQCTLTILWTQFNNNGTLSMAFVVAEQDRRFRHRNLYDLHDNFLQSTLRPLAAYRVDFSWYSKINFLLETQGVILSDSGFTTNQADNSECLWVKNYDKLYLWQNGLLRGVYNLLQIPDLNTSWNNISQSAKNIQVLPFSDREHTTLLNRYEDSIFTVYLTTLSSTGKPDTTILATYFSIYGKYDTRHSLEIENTIFNLAKEDMSWGYYYINTYDSKRGRYYNQIDDLSFAIVKNSLSHAQTYKKLFPTGKHLAEANEILIFEKACRNYDRNIYLSKYPDGVYASQFDQYMVSEEQRLYQNAALIFEHTTLHDIDETMRFAVHPYMRNFPEGPHITEITEMYYYGIAFQKKMAAIYTSRYPSGSPRALRLRNLIDLQVEQKNAARATQRTKKQAEWIHRQIMNQPFTQYLELQPLDGGGYQLNSLHITIPPRKNKEVPCTYEREMATLVMFDRSSGTFYLDDGSQRRYESESPFLTLKMYLMEGYDEGHGLLFDAEQWFLHSCGSISTKS